MSTEYTPEHVKLAEKEAREEYGVGLLELNRLELDNIIGPLMGTDEGSIAANLVEALRTGRMSREDVARLCKSDNLLKEPEAELFEEKPEPEEPDPQPEVLAEPDKSITLKVDEPLPEKWVYTESVKKSRGLFTTFKEVGKKFVRELWVAHEMLSTTWEEQGRSTGGTFGSPDRTWAGYCAEVGILKRTANRWLERYDVKEDRKLEAPKKEKPEEFRPRDVSGNYRKDNRPPAEEFRPLTKYDKVARFWSGVENEIKAIREELDHGIPEMSLELAEESSEGHDILEKLEAVVPECQELVKGLVKMLELQRRAVYGPEYESGEVDG